MEKNMNRAKRFLTLACFGAALFAALASSARADDDWGRMAVSIFLGGPAYSPPVYVAPPPPPPPRYVYYGPPAAAPGYYYHHRRDYRWHDHGRWGRHEEGGDE